MHEVKEGDWLSIDGTTGEVYLGKIKTLPSEVEQVLIERTMKPEESEVYQRVRAVPRLGRRAPPAEHPHKRRHPGPVRTGDRVRRRGHRPLPHRAHVLRRRPDTGRARR